jgi:hypothetical protein
MSYGIVEYDKEGKPICEICKKSFKRVLSHVRQKHDMNEREYKKKYGLDLNKGICSKESSELSRERVMENYDKVVTKNLVKGGSKSRFKDGSKGRVKANVSQQTRIALKKRLKTPEMKKAMSEAGKRVGKSGLGNKKRWSK